MEMITCLVNKRFGNVANMPGGSTGGEDHVISPIAEISDGKNPNIAGLNIGKNLLDLLQLQNLRLPVFVRRQISEAPVETPWPWPQRGERTRSAP